MTIDLFIEYNFAPIIGLLFQVVILLFGKSFDKKEKIIFYIALWLQVIELSAYNLEIFYSSLDHPTTWRIFYSVIGYIVRPSLIYPFVLLLRPEIKGKWSKLVYLDLIPLLIVIIIQQFAFGTHWVFYFTNDNHYVSGPLGKVSEIITILYMVEAGVEVVLSKVINRKFSVGLIVVLLIYVVLAMVFESVFDIRSLGISAGVFSIVFFMFSSQTNHLNAMSAKLKTLSEVDSLSILYNRYAGEKAIDELISSKTKGAFYVMDIDSFKYINDTYGHAIGDEAIRKVAQAIKDSFTDGDMVMRLGGDEFAVYSINDLDDEKEKQLMTYFFERIDQIRLSSDDNYRMTLSVGVIRYDASENTSFDKLYRTADTRLYKAKKQSGNCVCNS